MVLVHVDDLNADVGERFTWALRHWVAVDRETGAYMAVSHGRRRSGRATRYYVMAPAGPSRWTGEPTFERAFTLTAWNDDEAVATANTRLVKWLAKGLTFDQDSYTWKPRAAAQV